MNEQTFEGPTTKAQNKEGRIPPRHEWAGLPAAGLCEFSHLPPIRFKCFPFTIELAQETKPFTSNLNKRCE